MEVGGGVVLKSTPKPGEVERGRDGGMEAKDSAEDTDPPAPSASVALAAEKSTRLGAPATISPSMDGSSCSSTLSWNVGTILFRPSLSRDEAE